MKNMTTFQLVLTGILAVFILIGVALFALFRGGAGGATVSNVSVWGFVPSGEFSLFLENSGLIDDESINIEYTEVNPETFDQDFIETLARGESPDLIMIPHTSLVRHRDKLVAIPYDTYSQRDFLDTFVEEGELFLSGDGVLALPIVIDPLVMYWNRTMFSNVGIASPPEYWSEFFDLADRLVERDESLNITQSAIAFGEYQNVNNSKAILSALIMQAGSDIVRRDGGGARSVLGETFGQSIPPAEAAVNYYTQFSNPVKSFYSWNRSLPNSRDFFTAGDLAVYFGFASEIDFLSAKNPNLNFDATAIPQSKSSGEIITYGNIFGLAIPQATPNKGAAFRVATILTSRNSVNELSRIIGLPPVRKDLIDDKPSDPFLAVFYDSALWSRGWLDPDRTATNTIFKNMIEDITSGRSSISSSVVSASSALQNLLKGKSI